VLYHLTHLVYGAAQSSTDGSTPLSIQPGAPAGSLGLDDFENVNLFNGNLNFTLPLYKVIGRGEAAVPVNLPIEWHWRIQESLILAQLVMLQ